MMSKLDPQYALEMLWKIIIKSGFTFFIWSYEIKFIAKKIVMSQFGNLIPNH